MVKGKAQNRHLLYAKTHLPCDLMRPVSVLMGLFLRLIGHLNEPDERLLSCCAQSSRMSFIGYEIVDFEISTSLLSMLVQHDRDKRLRA